MIHRTVVNCETGVVTQVEYTAEEQATHDAAVAEQAKALALAEAQGTEIDASDNLTVVGNVVANGTI